MWPEVSEKLPEGSTIIRVVKNSEVKIIRMSWCEDSAIQLAILKRSGWGEPVGWKGKTYLKIGYEECVSTTLVPTKPNGYVQASWEGVKPRGCTLNVVACTYWNGTKLSEGWQASHLCHNNQCINPVHLTWETVEANNRRKGCAVWRVCACLQCTLGGCPKKVWVCHHSPRCVKADTVGMEFHLWEL